MLRVIPLMFFVLNRTKMEFGGLPPEGPMMPRQNGIVDASMMPQQNGLVEGDRSEMVPQPNNV